MSKIWIHIFGYLDTSLGYAMAQQLIHGSEMIGRNEKTRRYTLRVLSLCEPQIPWITRGGALIRASHLDSPSRTLNELANQGLHSGEFWQVVLGNFHWLQVKTMKVRLVVPSHDKKDRINLLTPWFAQLWAMHPFSSLR